jgi:hypothetical protein
VACPGCERAGQSQHSIRTSAFLLCCPHRCTTCPWPWACMLPCERSCEGSRVQVQHRHGLLACLHGPWPGWRVTGQHLLLHSHRWTALAFIGLLSAGAALREAGRAQEWSRRTLAELRAQAERQQQASQPSVGSSSSVSSSTSGSSRSSVTGTPIGTSIIVEIGGDDEKVRGGGCAIGTVDQVSVLMDCGQGA